MTEVTRILNAIDRGDLQAAEQLLPLIYDALRRLAAEMLSHEKPGQTLPATALVHEAYIRLVDTEQVQHWHSRGHFFAAAAEAMRRILVDSARRKQRIQHGGQRQRINLDEANLAVQPRPDDLLALHEALERLVAIDPHKAELVKLCYFAGLTIPQAAAVVGISPATAERHWAYARAWLHQELTGGD